jgi:hypothetical protein
MPPMRTPEPVRCLSELDAMRSRQCKIREVVLTRTVSSRLGGFCVSLFPVQFLNGHVKLEDFFRKAATRQSSVRGVVPSDTTSDSQFSPKLNDTQSNFLFLSRLGDTTSDFLFHLKLVGCRHCSEPRNLLTGTAFLNHPMKNHSNPLVVVPSDRTSLFLLPSTMSDVTSDHIFLLEKVACHRYSRHRTLLSAHPLSSTQRDWHFYLPPDQKIRVVPVETLVYRQSLIPTPNLSVCRHHQTG